METTSDIRSYLLRFCADQYGEARAIPGDEGGLVASLITRGILAARRAIENSPIAENPRIYLDTLRNEVRAVRSPFLNDDCDPKGWTLGGIRTILIEVERLQECQPPLLESLPIP